MNARKNENGGWPLAFGLWRFGTIVIFITLTIQGPVLAQAQIPVNTWRLHLSYNSIRNIAIAQDYVYASAESGVLVYNKADGSISSLNTLNALSSTDITALAYNQDKNQLLIGYADGNLDILSGNEVVNFTRIKSSPDITGSKRINHINTKENLAYLSTDFGVVVFDLTQLELRETWRDLSTEGNSARVIASTFQQDSIFIATGNGVLAGNLNSNLLDFNNWKYFDAGDFRSEISAITSVGTKVYAAIDTKGIYQYETGQWIQESFLSAQNSYSLNAKGNSLLITTENGAYELTEGILSQIETDVIASPVTITSDEGGKIWIGDSVNGLLSNQSGNFESYLPNGPTENQMFRLKYLNDGKGTIAAFQGGFSEGAPLQNSGVLNLFNNGEWTTRETSLSDLTDIEVSGSIEYLSSFGKGVQRTNGDGVTLFDDANSTLQNINGDNSVFISALEISTDGLWVTNYGANNSLHLFRNNEWSSFSFPISASRFPTDMVVDFFGQVWMALDPSKGGGVMVYNPDQDAISYRKDGEGFGGLLSPSVNTIALDRDGYIWVGTEEGVAYFFSATSDAAKPIFENRFLLRDENITAIEIDGGNRKWVGTERGVWLFSPTGEELIHNFTAENSPLLSNVIIDIEIHDKTGEVFFATDKGIISYRADASESTSSFTDIRIFPNPVNGNYSGTIGIDGLATDAIVKITDVSGKLIWETQANGGTASWNVRDYNGRRAATGIYLVFASSADGTEGVVGKIAVVD